MQLTNTPAKLVLPFANAGSKNTIPTASQIGITAGAASLTDGFPPLTRTPIAAGGVPPSGLDMNGILYELSAILRWANAGGGYAYDAAFATDSNVGGYPKGARIMRSDGLGYWFNTVENNTTDPEAAGAAAAGWVPDFTNGVTAVTMTSANVTLTPLQYGKPIIVITGTLTDNLNLIFPAIINEWTVINNTTGAYSVTCKTAAGTGVAVTSVSAIVGDATNIYQVASGITQAAADARYLQLTGGTLTGLLIGKIGTNLASAATLNLSTATGNTVRVTGTTATSAVTMTAGQWMQCIAVGAWPLTYHATNNKINTGGADHTCAAGDSVFYFYDGTTVYGQIVKADGTAIQASNQIQPISASVAANALTISASALLLDFRSTTLTSGAITTVAGTPSDLVVPSSATLGTINATAARLVVLALNNAGTIELAVINLSGGVNLDETGVITTTTISSGATANNVAYSTTGRTGVAYRVIGFLNVTEATAGTWATAPSTIQGAGGQALAALSSVGYGQTWQSVTRTPGTTYYNTTGKPIQINVRVTLVSGTTSLTVGGIVVADMTAAGTGGMAFILSAIIPPGAAYLITVSASNTTTATELR